MKKTKNLVFLFDLVQKEDPFLLLMLVVETLCSVAIPFLGIYLPKLTIDLLIVGASPAEITARVSRFTLAMVAVYFISRYASSGRYWRINTLRPLLMNRLFLKTFDYDYGEIESPEGQKRYQRTIGSLAYGDQCTTSRIIPALTGLVSGILGFALYSMALISLHPLIIAMLVISSLVNYYIMRGAVRYDRSRKYERDDLGKKLGYIHSKTADFHYGKDIRLYGAKNLIFSIRDGLLNDLTNLSRQVQQRWYFVNISEAVTTFLRDGLAYTFLIWLAAGRRITVADLVFYFGAISGFSVWLISIIKHVNTINGAQVELSDIREYLEHDTSSDPENFAEPPDLSHAPSIEFDNVSFSYTKDDRYILRDFNLKIKSGEKVAIVGANGAGKTTLIKLLCGLYKPDNGRILINGVDISRYRRSDLYAMFSAVFQEIMILPYTLAENVSLHRSGETDKPRVTDSLKKAGLMAYTDTLPKGIDTTMLRHYSDDGVILSGGQQQKLLLARALYKDAPVLVLDEPTAALDPIAESELYDQYHTLARNKTALFISHRLASTRFCDVIVYLNNAVAEEVGSHEELIRMSGGYAHMYEIQSHYYNEEVLI